MTPSQDGGSVLAIRLVKPNHKASQGIAGWAGGVSGCYGTSTDELRWELQDAHFLSWYEGSDATKYLAATNQPILTIL